MNSLLLKHLNGVNEEAVKELHELKKKCRWHEQQHTLYKTAVEEQKAFMLELTQLIKEGRAESE